MLALCVFRFDGIYNNVLQIARRPSEDEGRIIPRIFGILGLMLGPHSDEYFAKVESVLEPLVKSNVQSDIVRAQALEGLGVVCFTCSTGDEENAQNIMGLCDPFFNNSATPVLAKLALETWGCLASTLDSTYLIEEGFLDTHLTLFLELTNNADVDVRSAAGENLALLFEAMHQNHIDNYEGAGDIASKLLELSKESSKKFSKKDRKEQHSVFRDVYNTVANQEPPNVSFGLENETLRFHDWGSIMQYNAIKECLQSGMLEHLKFNNHVRQLFDLPHTAEVYSRVEKRATKSKTSGSRKQQSAFLKDERKRRQGEKNTFLEGGGHDGDY
ncbi:hypothetical protein, variant [Aphanomyces astaci]|uniref:Interferon-related developmental regulator N-terminal domain-containing protein n=1 Tax=Aphanomyces astaci TaxID=112090 RepID=W4GZ58_APHAT|nr:hypothetical protein, variant [Aphanomyces astaci]ETV84299.1 hypothetical protein, variant [Aphanomyces astaci]|eukprot:XP_009825991.1 hypothetical protein, variant [Aphanomyces astaci]